MRLTDFLQELEEESQQKENSKRSGRDSIDTNSTRYDGSSDSDSSEGEDVMDTEVELGSCIERQIGKSRSYTQAYHKFCGIELNAERTVAGLYQQASSIIMCTLAIYVC